MKTIIYPDSQLNVQIDENDKTGIIKQRINSYTDLFELTSKVEVIKHNQIELNTLFIPCLFGQRSDRRFNENESFGLKIVCDFINQMGFKRVEILDTHSDVSLALINNSVKISSFNYVQEVCNEITKENLVLISPDAGAYKKVFKYGEDLNLPVIAANKFRDIQGNITLNILGDVKDKDCLIVDDICDGGYTFLLLGEKLKELGAKKVYLYISHGYFSKGFKELNEILSGIYSTNSIKDIGDFIPDSYGNLTKTNLKQFKVI